MGYALLFDIDKTMRLGDRPGDEDFFAPGELIEFLRPIRGRVVAATGRSLDELEQFNVCCPDLFQEMWTDYAAVQSFPGTQSTIVVPEPEQSALLTASEEIERELSRYGKPFGLGARTIFVPRTEFGTVRMTIQQIMERFEALLSWVANSHDGGITVLPASAGKHQVVQSLAERGLPIAVAAGDSFSDLPMLQAATFPIVALRPGRDPLPELVAVVKQKGRGYVARRPGGLGLLDGLQQAQRERVISFV